MTIYARSDVCAVSISKDHGGCGETHSRPVIEGAPAKQWALTCNAGCEDHLRATSLWATTPETIPETPDETNIRLDVERRADVEHRRHLEESADRSAKQGEQLADALQNLPNAMGSQIAQAILLALKGGDVSNATVKCTNGHDNLSAAKFCAECGANMKQSEPEGKSLPETASKQAESSADPGVDLANLDPETTKLAELKEIAQQVGAPTARSKAEQISLIQQAVQQNDE